VLYQLLTGQPPFAGGTTYETIKLLLDTEPKPPRLLNPKIDRDLSTICLKCLEKDSKRRYSSALALAEDLERWLKHEPIDARRTGTHLRLNAQLIDTRTDTHVWAEQYDRDPNDLFAVQSEIAQKVAGRLSAKVTSAERLAIEEKPTTDLVAFELYSRANDIWGITWGREDALQAIDLLNQAVARDPSFLEAYCKLAA